MAVGLLIVSHEDPEAERNAFLDKYGTWDAARNRYAHRSEDVDEALRLEALASLDVLEHELGPDWPREAMFDENGLGAFLGNAAGWPARQLVIVAREFELFKHDAAWPDLVKKLRRPKSREAHSVLFQLHVAAVARHRGLDALLEPPAGTGKVLDVLVRELEGDIRCEYYVECTEIQPIPDVAQRASNQQWGLWPFDLFERNLQARVDLEPDLSDSETSDAKDRLTRIYDEVAATGVPQETQMDGLFHAWVAPVGHPDISRLVAAHGEPGLYAPFEHDPLHRLLSTIQRKFRQLRPAASNVVALRPSRLLQEVPLPTIRQHVKHAIAAAPHLAAIAIFHRFWGHQVASTQDLGDSDIVTISDLFAPLQEEVILIWNPVRTHTDADHLIRRHLAPDLGAWIDI
jgi:hypothetical protein